MASSDQEKIRKIYAVLPQMDCGLCGFGNCGQFARAVVEGRASPFGCKQNPSSGFQIGELLGKKVPVYSDSSQPVPRSSEGASLSTETLKEEIQGLLQKTEDILASIEKIKAKS